MRPVLAARFAACLAAGLALTLVAACSPADQVGASAAQAASAQPTVETSNATPAVTAHAFAFRGIGGEDIEMATFKNNAVLVVNTASRCGFTPQYDGLQELYAEYRDQGLVVLGVSSDSFNQELDTAGEVKEFCEVNFGIEFPMTDITAVIGDDSHAFYAWVRDELDDSEFPAWNFNKVLIGANGEVLASFRSVDTPQSPRVRTAVEAALAATPRAG